MPDRTEIYTEVVSIPVERDTLKRETCRPFFALGSTGSGLLQRVATSAKGDTAGGHAVGGVDDERADEARRLSADLTDVSACDDD
jgi:hypothetical protein